MMQSVICKGCWCQLRLPVPIRGPLSIPFRLFGIRQSWMNPNTCSRCERNFSRVYKMKQVVLPATILFADVRGYTTISALLDSPDVARLLSAFYDHCAEAIWARDGIVNKLIGDAVLAIFNFPITRGDHVREAVSSAIEIQNKCRGMTSATEAVGVGIGIHTGRVSIGEVGEFCKDYTAIGGVVNVASRLQGAARPGEVLVTDEVYREVRDLFPRAESRLCHLKGIEKPVQAYALS